jgi:pimeloyl-ACP methyl ester carboxylesterase
MAVSSGKLIQKIIDSTEDPGSGSSHSDGKYFDIIGFDPRGIGQTTPSTGCFPDEVSVGAWRQQAEAQGFPHSNESFSSSWSRQVSLAQSCTWRMGDENNDGLGVGRYLSTPSVVEDMVAIVEGLGEWRETESLGLLNVHRSVKKEDTSNELRWDKGKEKLLYWGFSYGTLLGATFAAMHPNRVGRVILDGVVDAEDYYSGLQDRNLY